MKLLLYSTFISSLLSSALFGADTIAPDTHKTDSQAGIVITDELIEQWCSELKEILIQATAQYQAHLQDPSISFNSEQLQARLQPFRLSFIHNTKPSNGNCINTHFVKVIESVKGALEMIKQHDTEMYQCIDKVLKYHVLLGLIASGATKKQRNNPAQSESHAAATA
ncbi:MAG: hypothetical protein WCE21_03190 [Candidatus Babeliales bacterium]